MSMFNSMFCVSLLIVRRLGDLDAPHRPWQVGGVTNRIMQMKSFVCGGSISPPLCCGLSRVALLRSWFRTEKIGTRGSTWTWIITASGSCWVVSLHILSCNNWFTVWWWLSACVLQSKCVSLSLSLSCRFSSLCQPEVTLNGFTFASQYWFLFPVVGD